MELLSLCLNFFNLLRLYSFIIIILTMDSTPFYKLEKGETVWLPEPKYADPVKPVIFDTFLKSLLSITAGIALYRLASNFPGTISGIIQTIIGSFSPLAYLVSFCITLMYHRKVLNQHKKEVAWLGFLTFISMIIGK